MTHCCLSQGLRSFFKRTPDGGRVDRLHHLQFHQPLGQQHHRPARTALGRRRAGDGDQSRFLLPVELAVLASCRTPAVQGRVEPLGHELLTHAAGGHERAAERLADPHVGPGTLGAVGVGLEQHLRPPDHRRRVGAGTDHAQQRVTLGGSEPNDNLVLGSLR